MAIGKSVTNPGESPGSTLQAAATGPPSLLATYLCAIDEELRRTVTGPPLSLYTMLRYHLGWVDQEGNPISFPHGKALRPALCLFTAEAVGGSWQRALPAAAALELVHNFSLIHDDIQDEDAERHHRPTVWAVWGKAQGVVAGNTMRVLADLCPPRLLQHGVPTAQALEVSRTLTDHYLEMIQGQVLDLAFEQRLDVSVAEYLTMVSLKTGALLSAAMGLGAVIGGAGATTIASLSQCGRLLGLAFQLRDDLLGVWGDNQQLGKPVGADIRQRKKAFPAVYALQHARAEDTATLRALYASSEEMEAVQVSQVLAIMGKVGAREAAQRLAEEQCRQALELADRAALSAWAKRGLEELASFLVHRVS